jgi:putative ATP-dependent endonuclease of OLD family
MYLSRIEIDNYLGIRSARIDLGETNLMIGENDSGKSAILEAVCKVLSGPNGSGSIEFKPYEFHRIRSVSGYQPAGPCRIALHFRERQPDEWSFLQANEMGLTFPDDRAKLQSLSVEVMATEKQPNAHWKIRVPGRETGPLDDDPVVLEWIRRLNPVFRIQGGMITRGPEFMLAGRSATGEADAGGGQILRDFERTLSGATPDLYGDLVDGFRKALNFLEHSPAIFQPEGMQDKDLLGEILGRHRGKEEDSGPFTAYRHGSAAGMIGMLIFAYSVMKSGSHLADPAAEPVFIVEDPEANLHPMTLEAVRLLINRLKWQKIITTQSGDFLSGYPMQDILRITRREGLVRTYRLEPGSLSGEELRRLSYHIRMRRGTATFARCWLLVEGESEIWLLPHLARLCGYELNMEGVVCIEFAQCGIAPLIKAARRLGIEWHLLADGDAAGKAYCDTARHFAREDHEDVNQRITRLKEKDIEHHLFFNGYAGVYYEYAGIENSGGQNPQPRRVIGRAIHRKSKPYMAIAVVEAIAAAGRQGIPPVLRKLVETCVSLSKKQ